MANVGKGPAGYPLTGRGRTSPTGATFLPIGTESGLTTHGVVIAEGLSAFAASNAGTNGQVLLGSTGNNPAFATITSSDGSVTFTTGANSLSLQVSGGTTTGKTIQGDTGPALSPSAGNWNIVGGAALSAGTNASVTSGSGSTLTITSINCSKWIVDPTVGRGTHTTITAAIAAASSGQDIFIRPGTYTEDLALKVGVNLIAFNGDADTPNVTIIGNATLSTAGTVCITGIRLQNNSASFLTVSGSAASIVRLKNCYLNCTNATGITYSTASASSSINMYRCRGDLGTTGIAFHTSSSTGTIEYNYCLFTDSGSSVTANSNSAGAVNVFYSIFLNPFTTTSTAGINFQNSNINAGVIGNNTALTHGGSTSSSCYNTVFASGSASAVSIGGTLTMNNCTVESSNTNAVTGAGTLVLGSITFAGSSNTINTTTTTLRVLYAGEYHGRNISTAPSAGMLGEEIKGTATSVALTNNTPATITSLSLTPGIWSVTGSAVFTYSGATTASIISISSVNNTLQGTNGDARTQANVAAAAGLTFPLTVPNFRVALSATTTYYLVGDAIFASGTCTTDCKIAAVRVG